MKRLSLLSSLILAMCATSKSPADWPQYLGPDRNAIAPEAKIARSWPADGPKQLWSFDLGTGFGGASIQGGEVYVLDRIKYERDILRCIDLQSGEEKWSFGYDAPGKHPHPGSRSVPTLDESRVYTVGPFGHFHCVDRKTHQPLWSKNIIEEFEAEIPGWGVAQSPLLYKDTVVVAPQGNKAGVAAFDAKTGDLRWASRKLSGHSCHVSPMLATLGGIEQIIMISPNDRKDPAVKSEVVGLDAVNGKVLWSYNGLTSFATITPAVAIDDSRVFLTDCSYNGSYKPVSIMIEVKRQGGNFTVKELFKTEELGSKMHPAVLYDGYLYINHCGSPKEMNCLSLEGEVMWKKLSANRFHLGAMILAGDLILNQKGDSGDLHLIEPRPEGYKELGKVRLFEQKKGKEPWAPLAFSDGKLILRDLEKMICLDLK